MNLTVLMDSNDSSKFFSAVTSVTSALEIYNEMCHILISLTY